MHDDFIPSRRLQLTLQDGMDGRRRQVLLSRPLIYTTAIILVLCLLGAAGFVISIGPVNALRTELAKTKSENEQLREKFEVYAALIDSLFVRQGLSPESITAAEDPVILPYVGEGKPELIPFSQDPAFKSRVYEVEQKLIYLTRVFAILSEMIGNLEAALPMEPSNVDCIPSVYPTFGRISDGWGMRISPFNGHWEFHQGIDIANAIGTPVYSTATGRVTEVTYDNGYGKYVRINHDNGYETLYAHLYSSLVKAGESVHKGQIVGLMGNSGMSTGPHLHYEVIFHGSKINPGAYLNRTENDLYVRR